MGVDRPKKEHFHLVTINVILTFKLDIDVVEPNI